MTTPNPVLPQQIYLIRHGEKPADPPASPPGQRTSASGPPFGVDIDGNQSVHSLLPRGWQRSAALAALFDPAVGPPPAGCACPPHCIHPPMGIRVRRRRTAPFRPSRVSAGGSAWPSSRRWAKPGIRPRRRDSGRRRRSGVDLLGAPPHPGPRRGHPHAGPNAGHWISTAAHPVHHRTACGGPDPRRHHAPGERDRAGPTAGTAAHRQRENRCARSQSAARMTSAAGRPRGCRGCCARPPAGARPGALAAPALAAGQPVSACPPAGCATIRPGRYARSPQGRAADVRRASSSARCRPSRRPARRPRHSGSGSSHVSSSTNSSSIPA